MIPAFYNSFTGEMSFGATTYSREHEWAHLAQHARGSLAWRCWCALRCVPALGYAARIAVEIEASGMALFGLWRCGALLPGDVAEAARELATYFFAPFSALGYAALSLMIRLCD